MVAGGHSWFCTAPGCIFMIRGVSFGFHGSRFFFVISGEFLLPHLNNNIQSELSTVGPKSDVENTPKCPRLTVSLPHDPARPCRPEGGFGLVMIMMTMIMVMLMMVIMILTSGSEIEVLSPIWNL